MATKTNQRAQVLQWLKTHSGLTNMEAVTELGIMSCPKRIQELRDEGYEIATCYRKSTSGARYGVYMLVE